MNDRQGRTSLPDELYQEVLVEVREYLNQHERVSNSVLRSLTGLNYDQAIKFFKRATTDGIVAKRGETSGTHYVRISETTL